MGFEFKPTIWFVCRFCRQAFCYLYKLKEHRVECHLGECLNTKCIIFEERYLNYEWVTSTVKDHPTRNQYSDTQHIQGNSSPPKSNDDTVISRLNTSNRKSRYKNPFVSVRRLTPQDLDNSLKNNTSFSNRKSSTATRRRSCRGIKRAADNPLIPQLAQDNEDNEPCVEKKGNFDMSIEISTPATQETVFEAEVKKIELNLEDLNQLRENHVISSSASDFISIPNDKGAQEIELEDREFIVASIVQSSDGTGNIQFVSTNTQFPLLERATALDTLSTSASDICDGFDSDSESQANSDSNLDLLSLEGNVSENEDISLPCLTNINKEPTTDVLEAGEHIESEVKNVINVEDAEDPFQMDSSTSNPEEISEANIAHVSSPQLITAIIKHGLQNFPSAQTQLSSKRVAETPELDVQVVGSPETQTLPNEVIVDQENNHCPENRENGSDNENGNCVTDPQPGSQNHLNIGPTLPVVTLSPEDRSLPLLDWLAREKVNDPSNVILLDPHPSSETVDVAPKVFQPMKCVLCRLKLTSDTQVKEHVKVCWTFNKEKHLHCVPCNKSYDYIYNLKRHQNGRHKNINLTSSSAIAEVIDVTESEAANHLHQQESQNYSQTIFYSNSNVFSSEANTSASASRYSTRRNKAKVNYCESQACRGCAKDFYTVEEVEGHQKLCPHLRPKVIKIKKTVETVDDDIQVIGSTLKGSPVNEIVSDGENYEIQENCESDRGTDDEMDDAVPDPLPRLQSPGHPKTKSLLPTIVLTPEELSVPLLDWLTKEKASDPSNVIILEPDPTSETLTNSVNDLHPIKCVLCKLELTSDTQVKEHVKVCWHFNKAKHLYCAQCKQSFTYTFGLRRHSNHIHKKPLIGWTASNRIVEATSIIGLKVTGVSLIPEATAAVAQKINDKVTCPQPWSQSQGHSIIIQASPAVTLSPEDRSLPLLDWLAREKVNDPSNIILLDPNPADQTTPVEVSFLKPIKCILCNLELTSDVKVKEHVRVCWYFNKLKHLYCVPCKRSYTKRNGLTNHRSKNHKKLVSIRQGIVETLQETRKYSEPLQEWLLLQKEEKHLDGSTNVILISPDPTEGDLVIDKDRPVTCLLCSMLLFSDRSFRNHVENCWWHNKDKHRRCIPCEFTFETPRLLQTHQNYDHADGKPCQINEESEDSEVEEVEGKIREESPIKCILCGEQYVSKSTLKVHRRFCRRFNKKKHKYCVPCETSFSRPAALNMHNCMEHFPVPEFPYKCSICSTGFKEMEAERKHVDSLIEFAANIGRGTYSENLSGANSNEDELSLSEWLMQQREQNPSNAIALEPDPLAEDSCFEAVSEANPVTCQLCVTKFTAEPLLRSHVQICWVHNKALHRYCVPCKKSYYTTRALRIHRKQIHPKGPRPTYKCTICGKEYISLFSYKVHQESHTDPQKAKPFSCDVCPKSFSKRQELDIHMFTHSSERTFKCPQCPAAFKMPNKLRNHLTIHNQDKHKANKCKYCGRFYTVKSKLRDHERTHTGDRPFTCEVAGCAQTFPSRASRFIHTKRKHGGDLGLAQCLCPSCGKTFGLQSELDYHIQRWHTEAKDKPFKCPHEGCTKRFGMKFQIAPHMLTHSGEKPFQCEQCGRAFASKQTFKKHQLTHENEEAGTETTCELCPKKFREKRALKRHLKCHEKEPKNKAGPKTKFKCQLCEKRFATKSGLKKHEESHEDDEEEEVEEDADSGTDESERSESDSTSEHSESE